MRKGFRSLPSRILAAVLTAGMIVSSSNLDYVRFILPGVQNISQVEAAELTTDIIKDENLLKAMKVYVGYDKDGLDVKDLAKKDLVNGDAYIKYHSRTITEEEARKFNHDIDLSGCTGIKVLTGINVFEQITSIDISNYSGTVISDKAFENCTGLTKVIIPNTVTSIGDYAFNGCNSLSTIEVKGDSTNNSEDVLNLYNISKIGDSSFAAAKGFTGVVFDSQKTGLSIGSSAFNSCTRLEEISIPTEDYNDLGQGVFQSCSGLKKATLNPKLEAIPTNFFKLANMSQMEEYPSALKRIGLDSFSKTRLLTPDLSKCTKLALIDQGAFQAIRYTYNSKTNNKFILPDQLSGDGSGNDDSGTGIRRIAFFNSNLQSINIPDGITDIQDSVFEGCTYLTDVSFGKNSNLEKIHEWAFRRCENLDNTNFIKDLPSLKEIGAYAFSECYWLEWEYNDSNEYVPKQDDFGIYSIGGGIADITLPKSLEIIGPYAFANNYNVKTISMGDNIKEISEYAFAIQVDTSHEEIAIYGLTEVNNSESPFDQVLLSYTASLTDVTLSNSLTDLGVGVFKTNTHLTTVTYNGAAKKEGVLVLPPTVENIGNNAFSDCARLSAKDIDQDGKMDYVMYGLSAIDLKELTLESFGESVFENDYMLESAILPKNLKEIPKKLFYIQDTESKRIIDEVKIGDGKTQKVISKLPGVNSVTFPENVEIISESAFEGCENFVYSGGKYKETINKVEVVYDQLPSTLKTISNRAFYGCCSLGKVAMDESITSIGNEAFMNCSILDLNAEPPVTTFENGYGLTKVTFKPATKLESIGTRAFNQTVIDKADLSNNKLLEEIPEELFANCYYLDETLLPENVTQVASRVYANDLNISNVQLPAIAKVNANIFDGVYPGTIQDITLTLSARNSDKLVKVPIGQTVKLDFIKLISQNGASCNNYKIVQKVKGTDSSKEFITYDSDDKEDVYLTGILESEDNTTFEITNFMRFETTYNGVLYAAQSDAYKDYDLTVSDQYAEALSITGPKEKIQVAEDGSKILSLSINDTNAIDVTASVEPSPLSKAPVWGVDSSDIITVDEIDPDDEVTLKAVNDSNISTTKIYVKGGGTTKLWVSNGLEGDKEVRDEVTVKVIYPVNPDPSATQINIGSLDSDAASFKLEENSTDTITVTPSYSEEAVKAGSDSQAKIYFVSNDPSVATIDRNTGAITAKESGDTTIYIYDETGTPIKNITLSVVKKGELTPNYIKISEDTINVYKGESSGKITAKVYPDIDYLQGVTWSVENEEIATVTNNEDGSATVKGRTFSETPVKLIATSKVDGTSSSANIYVTVPVTTFKFQNESIQLATNAEISIPPTIVEGAGDSLLYLPEEAHNNKVSWDIADKSVAQLTNADNTTLASGIPTIKALKQGETTLTATTNIDSDKVMTATLKIFVYDRVNDFSIEEKRSIHVGDTFNLNITKDPASSKEQFKFLESSNPDVATVDANGKVTGVGEGTAVISVSRLDGTDVKPCSVTVVKKVDQIAILDAPIELSVDGTYSIGKASEDPEAKNGYRLTPNSIDQPTWSSSNPAVASIDSSDGTVNIKGVAPGTAEITATTLSGQKATIAVSVVSLNTELKFTEESKKIAVGTTAALTVIKAPVEATESITYTSSNEEIATVDQNGIVTGIAKGDVTIYATGKISNLTAGIPITVTLPATSIKAVTYYASEKKIYLVKGNTYQFRYKVLPEDTTDTVTFSTNKKKVATVSEDGTITAKKKGNATITVKTESGKTAKIKVYVVNKEKNAKKIKIKTSSVKVGKTVRLKYTVTAATTTNTVGYAVNKPEIAEIDEFGYITGHKKGKVKVTITMSNGKTKTKTIKVKK